MIYTLHVKPGARKNSIEWIDEDTAKVWVTSAPEKGKANKAVIDLLSKELGVPKSSLEITRGTTAKIKQVTLNKTG